MDASHAMLINNTSGTTQNTPVKGIAAFSIFFFFLSSKLDSYLTGKNSTSSQLFVPAPIQYKEPEAFLLT